MTGWSVDNRIVDMIHNAGRTLLKSILKVLSKGCVWYQ